MRCEAIKEDGERCGCTFGLDEDGLCWHHSKKWADKRRRAIKQGGKTTAEKRRKFHQRTVTEEEALEPPKTAEDAVRWASWVTWAAATGRIDKGTAREVSGAIRTFLSSLDKAEVERAVEELRSEIAELRRGQRMEVVK